MKEGILGKEEIPSISYKQEALSDAERFRLRMVKWMESVDELWDEYEKLRKYSLRQKE